MYQCVKRFFDFTIAAFVLLLLSPFLIPIMIGLLLTGEGYVFYFQKRVGYKNEIFNIWKFATMLKDSPSMKGGAITLRNDPRITPLGEVLRKWKINEIPQLFNIIRGEMSIVGPRPLMKEQSFDYYSDAIQKVIYNVRPGLTGIGSIVFRDEEELISNHVAEGGNAKEFYANVIFKYKGEIESWYQANTTFLVDLKIIVVTAWVILKPKSNIVNTWFPDLPKRNLVDSMVQKKVIINVKARKPQPLVEKPTVTIITVTRNSASTLEKALRSIRNQSYKNIELIIVDGDSSDNTLELVGQYKDIVTNVVSEQDYGIYDGMNKGLSLANGDIIGFLNSDDYLSNNEVIQKIVSTLLVHKVDSVYGDLKYVDQNDLTKVTRHWIAKPYDPKKFLYGWMPPHPTFYVRSFVYKYYGDFDLRLRNSADYELMLRFLYKHEISSKYINDVLVIMREGGASNFSLQARINANIEDRRSWRKNNLKPKFYTIYMKPLRKIKQFIYQKNFFNFRS